MTPPRDLDVVVVGASLGGLTSAALLARRGYRVAVLDKLDIPGGRCGSIEYEGYHIPFGHRDGHGVGDNVFGLPLHFVAAADDAGVEVRRRTLAGGMRVHRLPERTSEDLFLGGRPGVDRLEATRETVGVLTGRDQVGDDTVQAYLEGMRQLRSTPTEEQRRLLDVTLGAWLDEHVADPLARSAILQVGEVMFPSPAERTSAGRLIAFLQESRQYGSRGFYPEDPETPGMQGLITPWVRAIEEEGGELWLGWKPLEIVVEDRRVTGAVAVNDANLVQEFHAPVVVTDYPAWELLEILDEGVLPSGFAESAQRMLEHCNDFAGWWAGLSRLPTRRHDGQEEDMPGWHRILWGDQTVKRYHGAFQFASCHSPQIAPPGKHLLEVVISHWGEGEATRWRHWRDAKRAIDRILDYVHWYYVDLDDCVEWSRYQYLAGPEMRACYLKAVPRLPVKVSTVEGLYLAGSTSEGGGAYQDLDCEAAMVAVQLIEAERRPVDARPGSAGERPAASPTSATASS
ncbi:MAG TPA: NAD(P)-binding protein [Acidimicrobiia bacterium]|jgi:phytoene dehydrogenase-like protein